LNEFFPCGEKKYFSACKGTVFGKDETNKGHYDTVTFFLKSPVFNVSSEIRNFAPFYDE